MTCIVATGQSETVKQSSRQLTRGLLGLIFAVPLFSFLLTHDALARGGEEWFSAWTVSHNVPATGPALSSSTVRMIVRPTISGNELRVKLENTVSTTPVSFAAAYVGVLDSGADIVPGTNRQLSFGGSSALTLGPGEGAWSDPVKFHVKALQRLAVSLDIAYADVISTHTLGLTTNYSAPGSRAGDESGNGFTPVPPIPTGAVLAFPFYWIAAVDVRSPSTTGTVVTFGDSITDGRCSTTTDNGAGVVLPDLYQRWTDVLAERLAALPESQSKAVANEGIAGNRIVSGGNGPPAIVRVDRDVLERAGATHVIFFEGTNDISGGADSATVIAGARNIIGRVKNAGLKIIGVTMIPRGRPASVPGTGFTALQEQYRLEVNQWMRTSNEFDAVIDFDQLMQGGGKSPTGAEIIRADYNCDYIHPNAAGYKAMGDYIDLSLFKNISDWARGRK